MPIKRQYSNQGGGGKSRLLDRSLAEQSMASKSKAEELGLIDRAQKGIKKSIPETIDVGHNIPARTAAMIAAIRLTSGFGGLAGPAVGAALGGGGEALAQLLENAGTDKDINWKRVLAEAAISAVPAGKIFKGVKTAKDLKKLGTLYGATTGAASAIARRATGDEGTLEDRLFAAPTAGEGLGILLGGLGGRFGAKSALPNVGKAVEEATQEAAPAAAKVATTIQDEAKKWLGSRMASKMQANELARHLAQLRAKGQGDLASAIEEAVVDNDGLYQRMGSVDLAERVGKQRGASGPSKATVAAERAAKADTKDEQTAIGRDLLAKIKNASSTDELNDAVIKFDEWHKGIKDTKKVPKVTLQRLAEGRNRQSTAKYKLFERKGGKTLEEGKAVSESISGDTASGKISTRDVWKNADDVAEESGKVVGKEPATTIKKVFSPQNSDEIIDVKPDVTSPEDIARMQEELAAAQKAKELGQPVTAPEAAAETGKKARAASKGAKAKKEEVPLTPEQQANSELAKGISKGEVIPPYAPEGSKFIRFFKDANAPTKASAAIKASEEAGAPADVINRANELYALGDTAKSKDVAGSLRGAASRVRQEAGVPPAPVQTKGGSYYDELLKRGPKDDSERELYELLLKKQADELRAAAENKMIRFNASAAPINEVIPEVSSLPPKAAAEVGQVQDVVGKVGKARRAAKKVEPPSATPATTDVPEAPAGPPDLSTKSLLEKVKDGLAQWKARTVRAAQSGNKDDEVEAFNKLGQLAQRETVLRDYLKKSNVADDLIEETVGKLNAAGRAALDKKKTADAGKLVPKGKSAKAPVKAQAAATPAPAPDAPMSLFDEMQRIKQEIGLAEERGIPIPPESRARLAELENGPVPAADAIQIAQQKLGDKGTKLYSNPFDPELFKHVFSKVPHPGRVAGAGVGAVAGMTQNDEDPLTGAMYGGLAGYGAARFGGATMDALNRRFTNDAGTTLGEKAYDAFRRNAPTMVRGSLLGNPISLFNNTFVAPLMAGNIGNLERGLVGRLEGDTDALPRAWRAFKELNLPHNIGRNFQGAWREAADLAENARVNDVVGHSDNPIKQAFSVPGHLMGMGDRAASHPLERAGYDPEEVREMLLTNNPKFPLFASFENWARKSPLWSTLAMPFHKTAFNAVESGVDRMPGIAWMFNKTRGYNNQPVASAAELAVRQGMGTAGILGGMALGSSIDEDTDRTSGIGRLVTNASGQYAMPVGLGYAIGKGLRRGKLTGTVGKDLERMIPLPSSQLAQDLYKTVPAVMDNLEYGDAVLGNPDAEYAPEQNFPRIMLPAGLKDSSINQMKWWNDWLKNKNTILSEDQ